MTPALNPFYDSSELLPKVRDLLSRNDEGLLGDEEIARRLGTTTLEITAALEALRIEGEVLP